MQAALKRTKLNKAVSFIHNSNDVEHQYSTVANRDDAYDTAGYILWHIWANYEDCPIAGDEEQSFVADMTSSYYCSSRYMTFYKFSIEGGGVHGKTLTLAANLDKVLLSAVIS